MSLDFDKLRKKLNTLQGQNDRSSATWRPPEGTSVIRIVPWKDCPDNPFVELHFHYLGRKTQLSPLSRGRADPIAEFADKLRSTGDTDDWKFSRQFSPKLRTFVPIIVRDEEDKGVRFWGFGKQVYTQLLTVIADDDWGDITDVEKGRDIGIEFIPEKDSDTNFAQTKILVKPKQTLLSGNAATLKTWLNDQPDISEIFEEPSYEELASFLERYLNPDGDNSITSSEKAPVLDSSTDDAPEESTEIEESTKKEASELDDVDGEFAKLFNED